MPTEIILPKVDMDMTRGKIAVWHVKEGDRVSRGAPLFDIETAKAAMEIESPGTGTVRYITAQAGDEVEIGAVVAWLYAEGEADTPPPGTAKSTPQAAAPRPESQAAQVLAQASGAQPATATTAGLRASPLARQIARKRNVSLATLRGSGPNGRIMRSDVEAALVSGITASGAVTSPLAVSVAGTGSATPILLLHGFASDSGSWAPMLKLLPRDRKIWRIDLPGHGKSANVEAFGFDAMAELLIAAVDTLNGHALHVVAHSLGGALAIRLAAVRPRLVASLTLIAPAGLGPEIDAVTLAGIVRAARAESLAPWLRRLVHDPAIVGADYVKAAAQARGDIALRESQVRQADALFPDGVQIIDMGPELARLTMPVRIVWGRQDQILPWRHALQAPGTVALNLLDQTGHLPQNEQPEVLARIIADNMALFELTAKPATAAA